MGSWLWGCLFLVGLPCRAAKREEEVRSLGGLAPDSGLAAGAGGAVLCMLLLGPYTRALPGGSHWRDGLSEPTRDLGLCLSDPPPSEPRVPKVQL